MSAVKAGIESWNDVFGYPVVTAELAPIGESYADDHVNYFIIDPNTSRAFAFADWRTNPNNGEIRGASVYFGAGLFAPFPDDAAESALAAPEQKPAIRSLQWHGQSHEPLCAMWGRQYQIGADVAADLPLTGAQKLERYVQYVVAHEIGHTLGLRHNFKGSLLPPSSSVMDYTVASAAIAQPTPGSYDRDALAYLYGSSTALPSQPFCIELESLSDPECTAFDTPTPDPLNDFHIPRYASYKVDLVSGALPPSSAALIVSLYGASVLGFVRSGTSGQAAAAWNAIFDGVRARTTAPAAAADALIAAVFRELYLEPTGLLSRRRRTPRCRPRLPRTPRPC
ncbi:MAG: hypothetical protein HC863_01535 [Myxococcales bacterium]|nr:hypothetical protein [Myxococcales bacterium]